ncbi:uncharacterized protein si:dkey-27h10.2 isoform X3 [Ctenopharyngodon idella]|uniref:uncharacterized protein si:dkey-27h10.2 isoform X3 n=1 Tax=Ctenopharyngodon idella TaxID=7959 RepID=UPI00222E7595|nr:uncharacterized protein si:dkey-27h10.2 isoform X3 [Ctenopharyngodon idella]
MLSPFKMCSTSLHLLIGALLVLAVKNELTTMTYSEETTTAVVSMSNDHTTILNQTSADFPDNLPTSFPPNSTDTLISTTDENMSDSPTSDYPQTNNDTTDDSQENVPKSSTSKIKSTASKITNHPQTNNVTTDDPGKNVPKSSATPHIHTQTKGKSNGITYIIILIIVVVCISGVVVYCCLQKKSRRYSVDLHPKQEDAHIPLSTVDAEVFDTTSEKDIQTFTPAESTEPLKDPGPAKETEKPEGGKESVDVKQENQQNLSSTQATVIPKDKTAELTVVDMTDGEPTISTKTSMESLDDALNDNNSNNTRTEVNGKLHKFTEISLDGRL